MEFTFETVGSNTFLVYEVSPAEEIDTLTLGMLTNNKIVGMVPVLYTQMNASKYLKYNVSAKISVKQFFSGLVNRKRLLGVFSSVASAIVAAEDYMINVDDMLLDTEYIFADVSSCVAEVVCMPIIGKNQQGVDVKSFFKNIMFSTQFDQTENCDYVARIINYLNGAAVFVAGDFLTLLEELIDEQKGMGQYGTGQQAMMQQAPVVQQVPVQQAPVQQSFVQNTPVNSAPVKPPVTTGGFQVPGNGTPAPASAPINAAPTKSPAPASGGFAIPGGGNGQVPPKQQPPVQQSVQQPQSAKGGQEKEMSMFYLLQHYNKENKEIYKAQKEQKKSAGKAATSQKQTAPKAAPNAGFAVPGQNNNAQMAVPQSANKPMTQQPPVKAPMQQPQKAAPVQPVGTPVSAPISTPVASQPSPAMNQFMSNVNFGETTVLGVGGGGVGETTVLSSAPQQVTFRPYLVRMKNNEKIYLDKPMFKMGKEKSYVDYFIGDNPAISRSHADFIVRDEKVYVIDRNSTNHTYVNGQMIQSNVEVVLGQDAKVKLANEEFHVCMY